MNWYELSEVNFGLIIDDRHPATLYDPKDFSEPYWKGVEVLQKQGAVKEDVAKVLSGKFISDAHNAVKKYNGIGEYQNFDWITSLKDAKRKYDFSRRWSKALSKLEENEDVDLLPFYGELSNMVANEASGLTIAKDIDYTTYKPFSLSGNPVLDKILMGIPTDGPIIVYGTTGVGKSHWAASAMDYLLHQFKDRTGAIYTLEMGAEHYLNREIKMYPSLADVLDRLYVSGSVKNIEELVAEVAIKNVDYVVLDDMDNIVRSSDASEYERVYRRVKEICRFLKIPVFVLCQPNREAKRAIERGERFIGRYDVAWSGAAENSAALQIGLQRIECGIDMDSQTFPTSEDEELFYEIFWKSRDGWPSDYDPNGQQGPGAIIRTRSKQAWRGKPYAGRYKLWQPSSGGKTIGKGKGK